MVKGRRLFIVASMVLLCGAIDKVIAGSYEPANYYDEKGTLTISRVDTPDQVGNYQDAKLQFDPSKNAWVLQDVKLTSFDPNNPIIKSANLSVYYLGNGDFKHFF